MLSISPISSSQADYYIKHARADYYRNGGEPAGQWHGKGAEALGLVGQVKPEEFRNLFAGKSPDGSRFLTQRQRHTKVQKNLKRVRSTHKAGWDFVFSAPKSVSVLWSQATPEDRAFIESAHMRAVQSALNYLEKVAGETRTGKGGKKAQGAKLVFATFEHGSSRLGDPALHTHCVLMNAAVCDDGKTRTVSTRNAFREKMVAGALYRAELATILLEESRLRSTVNKAFFEIKGVSPDLVAEMSKRRDGIVERNRSRGISSAKGSAVSAIETRPEKDEAPRPRADLFVAWRQRGSELNWSTPEASVLIGRGLKPEKTFRKPLAERSSLLITTNGTFNRRDLIQALSADAMAKGATTQQILQTADRILAEGKEHVDLGNGRYAPIYGDTAKRRIESLAAEDLKEKVASYDWKYRRIAIAPTEEEARGFERASGIRTVTPEQFIANGRGLREVYKKQLNLESQGPGVASFKARFGPNILAPLEDFLDPAGDSRRMRAHLQKFGSNLCGAVELLATKAGEKALDWILLDKWTLVVLHQPEAIKTSELLRIVSDVDSSGANLFIDGQGKQAGQRKTERAFRSDLAEQHQRVREVQRKTRDQGLDL